MAEKPKNDKLNIRISTEDKEELQQLADDLTEEDPYMCTSCEIRFPDIPNDKQCPRCGGDIEQSPATASQIGRYALKFLKGIQGYSYYDALLVMNNTGMMEHLDRIRLSDLDGDVSLGTAINIVINGDSDIRKKLGDMPFSTVLRGLFAKSQDIKREAQGEQEQEQELTPEGFTM